VSLNGAILALLLSVPFSVADGPACVQCCKAEGLVGCPTRVRVFGDGSELVREAGAWRVSGIWWLDCDRGARFDEGSTVMIDHMPLDGQVLRLAYPPATVRCFRNACTLPAGACVRDNGDGSTFVLERCSDGRPLTGAEMLIRGTPPKTGTTVVRVAGRTLFTTQVEGSGANTGPSSAVVGSRSSATAPRTSSRTNSGGSIKFNLPDPPHGECDVSDLLQAESRRHVDMGDTARVRGDKSGAANEYRAAITMDPCNAYAWSSIGGLALRAEQAAVATRALRVAVRLMPEHYGAITMLGEAYEKLGRSALAAEAYQKALSIRPTHTPAQEGLSRTRGGY